MVCLAQLRVLMHRADFAGARGWLSTVLVAVVVAAAGCGPMPTSTGKDLTTNSDEASLAKRARIRLELASAYFSQGKLKTALDEVKQSIALDPRAAAAYNLRGLIYDAMAEDDLAEASFKHALYLDAKSADTMHNYGWYLCQRKRFKEADAQLSAALAVPSYRGLSRTMMVQGVCQVQQGQLDVAEKTLMRAYEIDAGNPTIAFHLANTMYRQGEFERARFYVQRINASQEMSNAESLWLAIKIERKLHNASGEKEFGNQLKGRFPQSREAAAYEAGRFDE